MILYSKADARTFFSKIRRDHLLDHCASLTFTSIISFIPMLALAYSVFTAFGGYERFITLVEGFVLANLAPTFADEVLRYVNTIRQGLSAETLGVFGFVGFIFTSIFMLEKIEFAFNQIWGVPKPRPWTKRVLNYWALLTLAPILLGASLWLTSFALSWLRGEGGDVARGLVFLLTFVGPFIFTGFLFSLLFYLLPNAAIRRRDALGAGMITAFIFEITKQGYAIYASQALGKSIYGSLAILPVFFLWLYLAWLVTLLGFELVCFMEARRTRESSLNSDQKILETLLLFDLLEYLGEAQNQGRGVEIRELVQHFQVNRQVIYDHLEFLISRGFAIENTIEAKRDSRLYHLAYGAESLKSESVIAALEKNRYRPRGPKTRMTEEEQTRVLRNWSLQKPSLAHISSYSSSESALDFRNRRDEPRPS